MINDKNFMNIASEVAKASRAIRRKVGAILVKDNNIIGIGYNGTPSGFDNNCEDEKETGFVSYKGCGLNIPEKELVTKPEVLHAETNAIAKCARSVNSSEGSTLYTTTSPCFECSKLIIQSGIAKVVYLEEYKITTGLDLLRKAGVVVEKISI